MFIGGWVIAAVANAATYYVNRDTGSNNNTGGPNDPWQTLQKAANTVVAGDIVYVRASSTPYAGVTMVTSGTATNPIKFIGYNSATYDLQGGQGVPDEFDDIQVEGANRGYPVSQIKTSPLINGFDETDNNGVLFNNKNYIEFRNFWITRFKVGVSLEYSDHCKIINCYLWRLGNAGADYDGSAIWLYASANNQVVNCVGYNAGQEAFTVRTDSTSNLFDACSAFCDDNSGGDFSATHYYFLVSDAVNNSFLACTAERRLDPTDDSYVSHGGRGFTIQARTHLEEESTDNVVEWCTTRNLTEPFVLRGRVTENEFRDSYAELTDPDDPETDGCITLWGGPYANAFRGIRLMNVDVAIAVFGNRVFDTNANDEQSAADTNLFENCIFECELAFRLSDYDDEMFGPNGEHLNDGSLHDFKNNLFLHCNFIGDTGSVFIESARQAPGNQFTNCIIYGFDTFLTGSGFSFNQPYTPFDNPLGFEIDYCCFHNPGSDFPDESTLGTQNIDVDPEFSEFVNYSLDPGSPCDGEGMYLDGLVPFDIDGTPRGNPPDIGVQEAP
jgi:hypothetical protein